MRDATPLRSRITARLRAHAESAGRGYPDWALRYLPILRRWRKRDFRMGCVLEIGANANGFARFAAVRVAAVDISMKHLREARAAQGVLAVAGDVSALPFRSASADLCVCMDTLEHLPENERAGAVLEIARVLASGGAAVIGFPSGGPARAAEERVRESYRRYTGGTINWLEEHAAQPLPDPDTLELILSNALVSTHTVCRTGNANVWLWAWMWRVLMCGWPGRGNAVFQVLLLWATPLLSRCHLPPHYRTMLYAEPRRHPDGMDSKRSPSEDYISKCGLETGQAGKVLTAQAPRVSVVIPTWNRCELVIECLESLSRQTYRDFETIVVDDGSTDGTAERLRREWPEAVVIVRERNGGFAKAVNAGIRCARGEFLFLLNNDMTLEPDCLEKLLRTTESANSDMTAPLVVWRDDPSVIYSIGDQLLSNGRPESIGFRALRAGFSYSGEVFGVSAGAGLFRRAVFDAAGLFDERFVAYFEDADLCFRARLAGFRAVACPEAVAYHIGSASLRGKTWWRSRQCFRNHALLVVKDMPAALLLRFAPHILAERFNQARHCFSAARVEFGALRAALVVAGAVASIVRHVPVMLVERFRIQRARRISLTELKRRLGRPS